MNTVYRKAFKEEMCQVVGERKLVYLNQLPTFELACASVSKRVFARNHLYGNMFCLEVHFHAN